MEPEDVRRVIRELRESSALGPDRLHPKFLKEFESPVAELLKIIFTESLMSGVVKAYWKTDNITPIYKNVDKQNHLNYQPVSLTFAPCKLLEKIVRNRIQNYLEQNQLLSGHQRDF